MRHAAAEDAPRLYAQHSVLDRLADVAGRSLPKGRLYDRLQAGYRSRQPERGPSAIEAILAEFARTYPDALFIQVGAHDGVLFDPLRRHILERNWSGIMVEPVPFLFDRLRENYRGVPKLAFENVAISDSEGSREFYFLPPTAEGDLPTWHDALGSFLKDTLISGSKHWIPDIEDRVSTMEVPCVTFAGLCDRYGVGHIDLVQIDTEGYDYEIIKLIDLDRLQPKII